MKKEFPKNEEEWKQKLDSESYRILREKGTEAPFTGKYDSLFDNGTYSCKGCGEQLFDSGTKFDSGCGWPSFDQAIGGKIRYEQDLSLGVARTEIVCSNCGGHLGHVFEDGPTETGQRYCVNSLSIDFNKEADS